MAKYNKLQVVSTMKETGMVPVFYHSDIETAKAVLKACYEGGVRAFEFTNRGDFAQATRTDGVGIAYSTGESSDNWLGTKAPAIGDTITPSSAFVPEFAAY